jgi:hypothetical protein
VARDLPDTEVLEHLATISRSRCVAVADAVAAAVVVLGGPRRAAPGRSAAPAAATAAPAISGLALRPNCECCDRDLPPDSREAVICSFECTFCRACAERLLGWRCPSCGGELVRRPIRPAAALARHPASGARPQARSLRDGSGLSRTGPGRA